MADIIDKLRGGDLRSIGRADEVAADVEKDPSLFEALFTGLRSVDPVLRARSADAIEKITRERPELLSKHKSEIITLLKSDTQQEVCWHMAQVVPRVRLTPREEKEVVSTLKNYLTHKSRIARASALEALLDLAEKNKKILKEVANIIRLQSETGSPALKSRARKLLKRLSREHPDV
jgi:oligoendopeptidase F